MRSLVGKMEKYTQLKIEKNYVVVGDIHGCLAEFKEMVKILEDRYGKNFVIFSVGDTIDRGDSNIETLIYTIDLAKQGKFFEVKSNHLDKFVRWLKGSKVNVSHGMQKTVDEFLSINKNLQDKLKQEIIEYYENLPLYYVVNDGVVVVHAGIKDDFVGRADKQVKEFVLYGKTTGRYTEKGFPERLDWTKDRKVNSKSKKIVYGHVVYDEVYINNLCYGIDTGAVIGNKLTAYNPETEEFFYVKSKKSYYSFD